VGERRGLTINNTSVPKGCKQGGEKGYIIYFGKKGSSLTKMVSS